MVGIGNNYNYGYNVGGATNKQLDKTSSTGPNTSVDTSNTSAANSAERIAELRAGTLGTVDFNTLAKTAGASPIASSTINLNGNTGITATSALPSSVTAIDGPGVVAATTNNNAQLKLETTLLASLANRSDAQTVEGDFNVSEANASATSNNYAIVAALG
jgi:hypothetical protein